MSLRDFLLFASLAFIVVMTPRRPFIGAIGWVLFGIMNPHRLTWGAAYSFPFAQVIALTTLLGLLLNLKKYKLKGGAAAIVLVIFFCWACVTTVFAFHFSESVEYLGRVLKIYVMTFVLLMLTTSRAEVIQLVGALAISLGFYGAKGGLFVVATGGSYMVNGPPDSMMDGNNSLGVGLVMVIPLMYFLFQQLSNKWLRRTILASMVLCVISVLGAYSRGAMLAISTMGTLLWIRGKNKLIILLGVIVFAAVAIPAMPSRWVAKMDTLQGYKGDESAMFRLYTWETAYNIGKDRFPLSGGFEWQGREISAKYSPLPTLVLVPHSIYFQVIGDHGFIGLAIYLVFWICVWRQCGWLRKHGRLKPERQWALQLGSMVQVSLAGYAVGGAFLDLAYWDLPYYLWASVAAAKHVLEREMSAARTVVSATDGSSIQVRRTTW